MRTAAVFRALAVTLLIAFGLTRADVAKADDISEAFLLHDLFDIMAEEGRASVLADGATPLQGRALADYAKDVHAIYDAPRMRADFLALLDRALAERPEIRADALEFAATDLGARVLQLEIAARRALLDDEVDYIARDALDLARRATPDSSEARRLAQVRARIEANDLIELNVALGLNTALAYYQGMLSEDAVFGLSAEMLLRLVWEQEPAIREDIEDWSESYFLMAYQPLDPSEMDALNTYVSTPLAQEFNRAMFRAFDGVFTELSYQVGKALGRRLRAEDL